MPDATPRMTPAELRQQKQRARPESGSGINGAPVREKQPRLILHDDREGERMVSVIADEETAVRAVRQAFAQGLVLELHTRKPAA